MCDVCHMTPCHPRCPNAPEPPKVYTCKYCGEAIVDGAFQESVLRSAPYFSLRIDGITELNNN